MPAIEVWTSIPAATVWSVAAVPEDDPNSDTRLLRGYGAETLIDVHGSGLKREDRTREDDRKGAKAGDRDHVKTGHSLRTEEPDRKYAED